MRDDPFPWLLLAVLLILGVASSGVARSVGDRGTDASVAATAESSPVYSPQSLAWPTLTPTPTRTPKPSPTPTGSATATPTAIPSPTAILSPSATPTVTPTPTATPMPTVPPPEYALLPVAHLWGGIWAVDVQGQYAYVGLGPSLGVLDISNPAHPTLVGQSGFLPAWIDRVDVGVRGAYIRMVVEGEYAYVPLGPNGLAIIRIADPAHPTEVSRCQTPGRAVDVAVAGGYAYVATAEAGLRVVQITDPTRPREVGSYPTTGPAVGVAVLGKYVCVVDHDVGLHILDGSDPAHPTEVASYASNRAVQVVVAGEVAYLSAHNRIAIISLSDPEHPALAARISIGVFDDFVVDMAVQGNYLYYTQGSTRLSIFNVEQPTQPIRVTHFDVLGGTLYDLAVGGRYAYIETSDGHLCTLDVADPTTPREIGCYERPSTSELVVSGEYAYVEHGVTRIVSIADPHSPTEVGRYSRRGEPVVVAGDYLYVLRGGPDRGLDIIDVADPQHPLRVEFIPGYMRDVAVAGNFAYIAQPRRLFIVDVTDPRSPFEIGSYDSDAVDYYCCRLAVKGDYVYLSGQTRDHEDFVQVLDASDRANPVLVTTMDILARRMEVVGGYLYLTGSNVLRILSLANPAEPNEVGSLTMELYAHLERVAGHYAYLFSRTGLHVVDVSDPTQPRVIASYYTSGGASGADASGDYVYFAAERGGLNVLRLVHLPHRCFLPIVIRRG